MDVSSWSSGKFFCRKCERAVLENKLFQLNHYLLGVPRRVNSEPTTKRFGYIKAILIYEAILRNIDLYD